jgi:hypothetical protein
MALLLVAFAIAGCGTMDPHTWNAAGIQIAGIRRCDQDYERAPRAFFQQ